MDLKDLTVTPVVSSLPPSPVSTFETIALKYLKHVAVLAGLGAASVVLVYLLQLVTSFDPSTLPIAYQGLAYLLVPIVIAAGQKVKAEVDAELQQEESNQALSAVQAENAALNAHNMELTAKLVEAKLI